MRTVSIYVLLLFIFANQRIWSTDIPRRSANTIRATTEVTIDGKADEASWINTERYSDFTQYEPANGRPSSFTTIVRMLYSDEGIYVFADLIDNAPDSISTELGERDSDNEINAEWFSIDLCPFDDGVNGFSFKITVSGVQTDIKRASGSAGRDETWDAIWDSETLITGEGWSAEIFIPFSSIRFPTSGNTPWGVNFHRFVARKNEVSSWNYVDKTKGASFSQTGQIFGFKDINPPERISLMPYLSVFMEDQSQSDGGWAKHINGGIDLKWGLNESFTLDATLVPDFSQVQSDDQVLNLTPYEIQYNERRQFFIEGSDVFNKGDIFYSRRIGAKPRGYNNAVKEAESESMNLKYNPLETGLINATKFSGRTSGGLGIGFLNAMSRKALAIFEDPQSGEKKRYLTEPFTNFSLVVIDQSLKNASYISLINTNVLRNASHTGLNYNANVTATEMQFYSKDRTLSLKAIGGVSQKYFTDIKPITGRTFLLSGGKTGGKFIMRYTNRTITDQYDPNDMGYLKRNNLVSNSMTFGFNNYASKGPLFSSRNSLTISYDLSYLPRAYDAFALAIESESALKIFLIFSINGIWLPIGRDDYFEPRVSGRMYHRKPSIQFTGVTKSDPQKILFLESKLLLESFYQEQGRTNLEIGVNPSIRFSDRLRSEISVIQTYERNDEGFVGLADEKIIFGRRDNSTLSLELDLSYMFSAKSYITLRLREYWAKSLYNGHYGVLENDGSVFPVSITRSDDTNYNAFNLDLKYIWMFAPGSEITLMWKEMIYSDGNYIPESFIENIQDLFNQNITSIVSLKMIYYIDYHTIRR